MRRRGHGEGQRIEPDQHREVADERRRYEQAEKSHELDASVEPLQQARPRGDVLTEHGLAHQRRAPGERLFDETPPLAGTDTAARAQADLGREEPVGRNRAHTSTFRKRRPLSRSAAKRASSTTETTAAPTRAETTYPTDGCLSWLKS